MNPGDAPWLFVSDQALVSIASGLVLLYISVPFLVRRDSSSATRALAWLLLAAAVNSLAVSLRTSAYQPEISALGYTFGRLSLALLPVLILPFVYRFVADTRPRERRVATALSALLAVPPAAVDLYMTAACTPVYSPRSELWFWLVDDDARRLVQLVPANYLTYLTGAAYVWSLAVLVRKAVAFGRGAGQGAWQAIVAPATRPGRGLRDFGVLLVGMVAIQLLQLLGAPDVSTVLTLLLACAAVWVTVNHSPEPTRLRFKLVSIPLAVVLLLLAVSFQGIVERDRADCQADLVEATAAVRRVLDARDSAPGAVRLGPADVPGSVCFVLSRPSSAGAYGGPLDPVFVRDGVDVSRIEAAEDAEREWLVQSYVRAGRDREPGESDEELASRWSKRFRDGPAETRRWSRSGALWVLGAREPRERQYATGWWEDDGRIYLVGWTERSRRAAPAALANRLALVLVACGALLVLGLPLLFRQSILGPVAILMGGVRRVEQGDLETTVELPTNDELGQLGRSFDGMVASVRASQDELQRINQMAIRFVPRNFLETLGHTSILDVRLGEQSKRTMTVLFTDVRDFTSLSEKLTPAETFAFVNGLLGRLGPAVRAEGGFIDKYLGDAVMALFDDASGSGPDHALRAAIGMRDAVAAWNIEREREGLPSVQIGVGLHHGELMLGVIGESERLDTTVLADAVNTASRLEGLTRRHEATILVSGDTLAALEAPGAFATRRIGTEAVKGREQPVEVHEVLGLTAGADAESLFGT